MLCAETVSSLYNLARLNAIYHIDAGYFVIIRDPMQRIESKVVDDLEIANRWRNGNNNLTIPLRAFLNQSHIKFWIITDEEWKTEILTMYLQNVWQNFHLISQPISNSISQEWFSN